MKIYSLTLKNFKRFTDLQISGIPNSAKLVLLIGANGSGKSSVFDAFEIINRDTKREMSQFEGFAKSSKKDIHLDIEYKKATFKKSTNWGVNATSNGNIYTFEGEKEQSLYDTSTFYGRSAFRTVPFLTKTVIGEKTIEVTKDEDRPRKYTDFDLRFENDIELILFDLLTDLTVIGRNGTQIKEKFIDPINNALTRIFDGMPTLQIQLVNFNIPTGGNTFKVDFKKGDTPNIHYDNLSAGEKEIISILINLLVRRNHFTDTIYFFDEIDLHLNTKLQYNFLKEIVEHWIPENCQFWTATHSLGFIEYAKQTQHSEIIDFDELNFDLPQILKPVNKEENVYEIAVGKEMLPKFFTDFNIFFVENKDTEFYTQLGLEKTLFIPANNRDNVYFKIQASGYWGIVDRDFLSDNDIIKIQQHFPKLKILAYYSIENYLYHPDNLEEYYLKTNATFNKHEYITKLKDEKNLVKNKIIIDIKSTRLGYKYFSEPHFNGNELQKRFKNETANTNQVDAIMGYLNSDEFEIFYKVFPMKSFATQVEQRQNINKTALAQTDWFKATIGRLLQP